MLLAQKLHVCGPMPSIADEPRKRTSYCAMSWQPLGTAFVASIPTTHTCTGV